jgi:hypothetical protein
VHDAVYPASLTALGNVTLATDGTKFAVAGGYNDKKPHFREFGCR